jgi:TolB protein
MRVAIGLGTMMMAALVAAGCGGSKQEEAGGKPSGAPKETRGGGHSNFSPTGTDILWVSNRGGNNDIWLLAADATEPVNLTRAEGGDNWPEWSPDGRRVVFQSMRNGKFDVYVVNVDGTGQQQLTTNEEHDYLPSWAPDGKSIVFSSWRSEEGDTGRANHFYRMDADGGNQRRIIATSPGASASATFSPDGRELVFSRATGENVADIVIANLESGEERFVTADSSLFNGSPVYSPDGKWLAFYADRDSVSTLDIMRGDGSDRRSVVKEGRNWYPRWSPDGKWLVYVAAVPGAETNLDVRAVSIESGEVMPIFTGKTNDSEPSWRP